MINYYSKKININLFIKREPRRQHNIGLKLKKP